MEPNSPVMAKKLWNVVRIVIFMIRKGIMKRKLIVDLHQLMMKRGKIAGKAIGDLMFHHASNFSCRPNDANLSFISPVPREYEFSCSNSPAFPFLISNKRRHHHNHNPYNYYYTSTHSRHYPFSSCKHPTDTIDAITTVSAVQKVLEMLNNEVAGTTTEASPLVFNGGFGRSPRVVRQLRVTDSPFPLKNSDEDSHVDAEAEEFIKKFYEQLRLQNR